MWPHAPRVHGSRPRQLLVTFETLFEPMYRRNQAGLPPAYLMVEPPRSCAARGIKRRVLLVTAVPADRDCGAPGHSFRDGHGPVRNVGAHPGSLVVRRYAPGRASGRQPGQSARLLGAARKRSCSTKQSCTATAALVRPDTATAGGGCARRRTEGRLHRRDPGVSHDVAGRAARGHQGTEDNGAIRHVVRGGASGRIRHRGGDCGAPPAGGQSRRLRRSDRASPELSSALWLKYNLLAERHTRALPRVFVEYANLLDDWRREIKRMSTALAIDLNTRDEGAIEEYIKQDLQHQRHCGPVTEPFGTGWNSAVYEALRAAARDEPWERLCAGSRLRGVSGERTWLPDGFRGLPRTGFNGGSSGRPS